jgi:hypothetical protein
MIAMHHSRNAPLRERAHAVHAALAAYRRCTSAQITQRCGGRRAAMWPRATPFLACGRAAHADSTEHVRAGSTGDKQPAS